MVTGFDGNQGAGLRELGKRERLRRIKEAASQAFKTRGYEGANTRDISRAAEVSTGTLFVYAKDKRELLFLVLNEELDALYYTSTASVPGDLRPSEQVAGMLRPVYVYFSKELELARAVLREMGYMERSNREAGLQAQRYQERMQRWPETISATLAEAQRAGRLKIDDCGLLARALFHVHVGVMREWLQSEAPAVEQGIATLTTLFQAVLGDREIPTEELTPTRVRTPQRGRKK